MHRWGKWNMLGTGRSFKVSKWTIMEVAKQNNTDQQHAYRATFKKNKEILRIFTRYYGQSMTSQNQQG